MDLQRIRELADAFEASDWDEIDIEVDGVRIHLSTDAVRATDESAARLHAADEGAGRRDRAGVGPARPVPVAVGSGAGTGAVGSEEGAAGRDLSDESAVRREGAAGGGVGPAGDGGPADVPAQVPPGADGEPVVAPSPGIFWRAPSPGEPPFVRVGDRVEPDTVVCIVELMKLMNRVAAGVSGTVTAVLVDNGQAVDKGGSLVLVERSSRSEHQRDPAGE